MRKQRGTAQPVAADGSSSHPCLQMGAHSARQTNRHCECWWSETAQADQEGEGDGEEGDDEVRMENVMVFAFGVLLVQRDKGCHARRDRCPVREFSNGVCKDTLVPVVPLSTICDDYTKSPKLHTLQRTKSQSHRNRLTTTTTTQVCRAQDPLLPLSIAVECALVRSFVWSVHLPFWLVADPPESAAQLLVDQSRLCVS
jgi:hypothetical protein